MGLAIGITPYSNGYYYISESITSTDPGYNPIIGDEYSIHKGTGTLSNYFIGTGVEILRNLSLGANFIVTLGNLTRANQYEFGDYENTFTQKSSENLEVSGIGFDYGLQYNKPLKNDLFLTTGLAYAMGNNYRSTLTREKERFTIYTAAPYSPDTLTYSIVTSNDSTRLPSAIRAGLAFGKKDKFVFEINYVFTDWNEAAIHGNYENTLASTHSAMVGVEYIPDMYSNTSFFKRVEYRFGAHYSDNYLKLNNIQLKEYGVSLGLGIRLNNSYSKSSFFFDFTRREGDPANGLHNENIFTLGASINLYDFWFRRRVYY